MKRRLIVLLIAVICVAIASWWHLSTLSNDRQVRELSLRQKHLNQPESIAPLHDMTFPSKPSVSKADLTTGDFEIYTVTTDLPPNLRNVYGIGTNGMWSGMSDPGQHYQEDDVVREQNVPSSRLVFAARRQKDNLWIVEYEFGGRSRGVRVDFFLVRNDTLVPQWTCRLRPPAQSFVDLRRAVTEDTCAP